MAETVTVELPAPVWWLLAERAEEQGMKVPEYLVKVSGGHVISKSAAGRPGNGVTRSRVEELHALGHTDRDIAVRLGIDVHGVMYHRKQLRLAPNPGRTA